MGLKRAVNRYVKYQFTVSDFADLFGMSEAAVRKTIQRGKFNPRDLRSIFHFWAHHHRDDDHVAEPAALMPASAGKPSLTIKKAHDTVESATTTEGEPTAAGVSP